MNKPTQRTNILNAAQKLKELLKPGLLGNYSWFEAVEVVAFVPYPGESKTIAHNVFSIYVAEPGDPPRSLPASSFLNKKPEKLKSLKGWKFGVTKRPVQISELVAAIEQYSNSGVWQPPGQKALQVGDLVAAQPVFCPSDTRTEVPLNAVLKNNFWAGAHVVEFKDQSKTTLSELAGNDAVIEELSAWLYTMLPLNIARVPDRIGNLLFQVPSQALIAELRRPPSMPVELSMAWHPSIPARAVVGEYRVEQDGLVVFITRFDFPTGYGYLDVPYTSGDIRFSVWDNENQILLSATSVLNAPGGKISIESSMSVSIEQPRRFKLLGPGNISQNHEIALTEPAGGWRNHRKPRRPQEVDWRARRAFKARMKQLVATRSFIQYGIGKASPQAEQQRAIEDLRQLIRSTSQGAIYLWDPYLSANDILNTLAFCTDAGTELRGLTSSKPSKKSSVDDYDYDYDDDDDGMNPTVTSAREGWINTQKTILDTAFLGPANLKLEFRMSWGIQGSFHDRFLLFPGLGRVRTRVWSLGSSINHIGTQHCIVQEIAYPEPVLQAFQDFWDESNKPEHVIWRYS